MEEEERPDMMNRAPYIGRGFIFVIGQDKATSGAIHCQTMHLDSLSCLDKISQCPLSSSSSSFHCFPLGKRDLGLLCRNMDRWPPSCGKDRAQ